MSGAAGAQICTSDSPETPLKFWPHATFDTKCSASKTYTVPVPAAYTCGPKGMWNAWDVMRPFVWPKCTGEFIYFLDTHGIYFLDTHDIYFLDTHGIMMLAPVLLVLGCFQRGAHSTN